MTNEGIKDGTAAIIVKDKSLDFDPESEFHHWLEREGFQKCKNSRGYFDGVDWIYVNINSKRYTPGYPGISWAEPFGNHAVTIDEFKAIYSIFKKYENVKPLEFDIEGTDF